LLRSYFYVIDISFDKTHFTYNLILVLVCSRISWSTFTSGIIKDKKNTKKINARKPRTEDLDTYLNLLKLNEPW